MLEGHILRWSQAACCTYPHLPGTTRARLRWAQRCTLRRKWRIRWLHTPWKIQLENTYGFGCNYFFLLNNGKDIRHLAEMILVIDKSRGSRTAAIKSYGSKHCLRRYLTDLTLQTIVSYTPVTLPKKVRLDPDGSRSWSATRMRAIVTRVQQIHPARTSMTDSAGFYQVVNVASSTSQCRVWTDVTPRSSMYGIFTYIWVISGANVSKYAIHGRSGTDEVCWPLSIPDLENWLYPLVIEQFENQKMSNMFNGKHSTISIGPFSIAMLVYQRVHPFLGCRMTWYHLVI